MKASKFTDAQKAFIIKQGEEGVKVAEICRTAGIGQDELFQLEEEASRHSAVGDDMAIHQAEIISLALMADIAARAKWKLRKQRQDPSVISEIGSGHWKGYCGAETLSRSYSHSISEKTCCALRRASASNCARWAKADWSTSTEPIMSPPASMCSAMRARKLAR